MSLVKLVQAGLASLLISTNPWSSAHQKVMDSVQDNQIIMFGEAHGNYVEDSKFTISLLDKLKKRGFNYFALELPRYHQERIISYMNKYALGEIERKEIPGLIEEIYEEGATGWLDLISEVKKAGFKIILYDAIPEMKIHMDIREDIAFYNLKEQIFDSDPKAKVVVYCGQDHTNEKTLIDTWLGSHLNNYTNDKVLSVCMGGHVLYPVLYCDLHVIPEEGIYFEDINLFNIEKD